MNSIGFEFIGSRLPSELKKEEEAPTCKKRVFPDESENEAPASVYSVPASSSTA
jgi:hypothetical protein